MRLIHKISLADWIQTSGNMIGGVLVPMMLMSLGARLASSQVADAWVGVRSSVFILIVRLVAALLVLWVLPLQGLERGALILFACLPSAVFNFMLADKFAVEPNKVASTVIVGHVLSLAFLPLGIWLAFI
jgi:predicted permease